MSSLRVSDGSVPGGLRPAIGSGMRARVSATQLYLITPAIVEPAPFATALAAACGAGEVAAVLLRLAAGDERTLVNRIKALAPIARDGGAAVIVAVEGEADLPSIAVRGGADGMHVAGSAGVRALRDHVKGDRIVGVGRLRARHDAMEAGEAGPDYLLFGEPRPDGSLPPLDLVVERAEWWAEIFQIPCVAYAPTFEDIPTLAATGAEFVAIGEAVWTHGDGPGAATALAATALRSAAAAVDAS